MAGTPLRIVVLRVGALGDVVLTLPAVHVLRERYPDASITAVGYPGIWEVAGDLVDEVVSIDDRRLRIPPSPGYPLGAPSPPSGSPRSARPAVVGEGGDDSFLIAWTVRDPPPTLRTAARRCIHVSPYPPPGVHAAAWLLQSLDLPHDSAELSRRAAAVGKRWRQDAVDDYRGTVLIHPGAGATWKRWPAERFAAVADALVERGHEVAIVEGPADEVAVADMNRHSRHPYPVIRVASVRRLASILAGAALYIGNDSGVTHLAAMAGVPTVALFGPTDPASWAPLGRVTLLHHCGVSTAFQGQIRVCDDPQCMEAISVDDVLAAAGEYAS